MNYLCFAQKQAQVENLQPNILAATQSLIYRSKISFLCSSFYSAKPQGAGWWTSPWWEVGPPLRGTQRHLKSWRRGLRTNFLIPFFGVFWNPQNAIPRLLIRRRIFFGLRGDGEKGVSTYLAWILWGLKISGDWNNSAQMRFLWELRETLRF